MAQSKDDDEPQNLAEPAPAAAKPAAKEQPAKAEAKKEAAPAEEKKEPAAEPAAEEKKEAAAEETKEAAGEEKKEAAATKAEPAANASKPAATEAKPAEAPAAAAQEVDFNEDSWDALDKEDLAEKKNLYEVAVTKKTHHYEPFNDPHDFHGYNIRDNKEQMAHVKVIANKENKAGRNCQPFDFYTVAYKAFMQEGSHMMKVLDSKKAN